jgi:hypothetical protein
MVCDSVLRHARCGRLTFPRLLTLASLCLLFVILGWQIWQRTATRDNGSPEDIPTGFQESETGAAQARKVEEPADNNEFVFRDNTRDQVAAATAMVGLGVQGGTAAPAELGLMKAGNDAHLWVLSEIESALPLRTRFLSGITDSAPAASGLLGTRADSMEFVAYIEALNKANVTPAFAFANSARRDVTYAHLMSDPNDYRGDVVHLEGRLKRVRRFNPPIATDNVRDLYEGWMFARERGAEPVCMLFTELPQGLQVADTMEVKVAFDGYFFKRYRFKAADNIPNQAREAPLLIGRTVTLLEAPVDASGSESGGGYKSLLLVFMAVVLVTVALAVGLTWWFRRGDRRVRSRIAGAMERDFQATGLDNIAGIAHSTEFMVQNEYALDHTPLPNPVLPPRRFTLDSNESKGD